MMSSMEFLRTPDDRFAHLPEFDYEPHYVELADGLRMAWVETGPAGGDPILCLHGEPSWSFLYRRMMPGLAAAGLRVICPDLIGFGRSDKPILGSAHSFAGHVEWVREFAFDHLDLTGLTVLGQDWGGLIGLRLLAEHPDRISRFVAANTGLPTGDHDMPEIWHRFRQAVQSSPTLDVARFVQSGCRSFLSDEVKQAYDAPFPDERYCTGPRAMPGLVPIRPDDPASAANRKAWQSLAELDRPLLVAFSDGDPITAAMAPLLRQLPGAQGVDHPVIAGAGHFLQEDAGPELAAAIARFVNS